MNIVLFFTQEEHELFLLSQTELKSKGSDDYKHGFENAMLEVDREYNLRCKKNNDNSNKKNSSHLAKNIVELDLKKTTES